MIRLQRQFEEFKILNGDVVVPVGSEKRPREDEHILLFLFIIDILEQGIKPSSCITYTHLLLEAAGRDRKGDSMKGCLVGVLLKVLNILDADNEHAHAPDISEDEAWSILERLSGWARLTCFFLLCFGCRCKDASHLDERSIVIRPDASVGLNFRITKNHKSAKNDYVILLTFCFGSEKLKPVIHWNFLKDRFESEEEDWLVTMGLQTLEPDYYLDD